MYKKLYAHVYKKEFHSFKHFNFSFDIMNIECPLFLLVRYFGGSFSHFEYARVVLNLPNSKYPFLRNNDTFGGRHLKNTRATLAALLFCLK